MHLTYFSPLWWLLSLLVLAAGYGFTLVDRPRRLMLGSFLLRCLAAALLVLALCRPGWMRDAEDLHVVFLVDVSQSVDLEAATRAVASVESAVSRLHPGDSSTVFTVADGVRLREVKSLSAELESWRTSVADDKYRAATRLEDAVLSARMAFPAGKSRRLVLLTDGQATHGDLDRALVTLRREGIDVVWEKLSGLTAPEASILALEPGTTSAYAGEVVRFRVRMAANVPNKGRVSILNQGVRMMTKEVELKPDAENAVEFDVPMTVPGSSLWTAELVPEQDHFPLNNQASATIEVTGKSRLLVIHREPREMRGFTRALQEQEFDVDVRAESGLPDTMDGLLSFDAVMLADIPATSMSPRQMELLKSYVQDFGGGLAMMGSENSFGLGGYYKTPVEEVLPLISRYEKEKEKPSLAMVLV